MLLSLKACKLKENIMKKLLLAVLAVMSIAHLHAANYQLQISPDDVFKVSDTAEWRFSVTRLQVMEIAEVTVTSKEDKNRFLLMLYFMRDSGNYGQFNTPQKMEGAVRESGQKYASCSVEKTVNIENIDIKGSYGFKALFTDAELAKQKDKIPEGQFLYLFRGMIRLSDDTALGFRFCTNDLNSADTKKIEKYILSFVKNARP
jgi:hypothetical protein